MLSVPERPFDYETLLNNSVNVIPLGIVLFFIVTDAIVGEYPSDPLVSLVQLSIIGLIILTYYLGRAIAGAERAVEEHDALAEANGE